METRTLSTALLQTQHDLHCTADSETIEKTTKRRCIYRTGLLSQKLYLIHQVFRTPFQRGTQRNCSVWLCFGGFIFYYQLVVVELWSIMSCHEPPGSSSNCCGPYITCKTERYKGTEMQLYQWVNSSTLIHGYHLKESVWKFMHRLL